MSNLLETPSAAPTLAEKQQMLARLLRRVAARPETFPLSPAQVRLWLHHRVEPDSPAYNIARALELEGALDVAALRRALDELVCRHEALRTTFHEVDGEPVQRVHPAAPVALAEIDLAALPEGERAAGAARLAREEALRPFDLERGPVLRAALLRRGGEAWTLLVTLHHVAGDGASMEVLVREVSALYAAFRRGLPSPLGPLEVQYGDYAAWQRRHADEAALAAQAAFWRARLAGAPPLLELPADGARGPLRQARARVARFGVDADASGALRALARGEGATPFMALLAAYAAVLGRWAGAADVCVGIPVSGRGRRELEGVIGFFVNTVVVRADLSGDPTGRELLARVRAAVLEAQANADLPFDRVVEELGASRGAAHTPLFQATFALASASGDAPGLDGVRVRAAEDAGGAAKFDLVMAITDGAAFGGALEYRDDLFSAATAERLAAHFGRVLAAMAADPDRRLSDISLLDEAERETVVGAWNRTSAEYPRDESIPSLFAARARACPEAVALSFEGASLTYAELDRRANRLAHYLVRRGVGAEDRVGLFLERGVEMIVSTLAALKAGVAYVPLDPSYPAERLAFMRQDAGVGIVLATSDLADRLPSAGDVVLLDEVADAVAAMPAEAPPVAVHAESLAYVMYTSGSTGRPKGIGVPHRAVARLVKGNDFARLGDDEAILQLAPTSFDAATFEIWGALLNGGELVVFPARTPTLEELGETIEREGITTMWLTAGLFHQVVDEQLPRLGGLRQLLAGGDALSVAHVRRVLEAHPHLRLINGYGPTENTTFSACHTVRADGLGATVPIGTPIRNSTAYVLDGAMRPVAVGLPGELCVGGDGLARGYVGRAGMTAETFVPNPFVAGERLYRTGDRVRWRADGTLEFLGRIDQQVKIRGFRIEPGEVEAVLAAHPALRDAAVVVRADSSGEKRLVAYTVAESAETAPTAAELRAWLKERIPGYMVPAAFVNLDALPLTPNGKVDRRALPDPRDADADEGEAYAAPRTETEEIVAGMWAEAFGRERVGVEDDFFDLGGHSLLATRLVARIRAALAVELPVRALFDHPTVRGVSCRVDELRRDGSADVPPVVPVPRDRPLPLSFAQQRLWFLHQMSPGSAAYNVPAALRLSGALDAPALERALAAVVERHEALRTTFATTADGEPFQVVHPAEPVAVPETDLRHLPAEARDAEALRLAAEEAALPFDLARGPVLRARLLRLDADERVLLVTVHHVAADGWSMDVVVRETSEAYRAFAAGRAPAFAPLPAQYADFAAWQRARLTDEALEAEVGWWRRALDGVPPLLELPTDRPRPAAADERGAAESFALSAEASRALRELSRREGTSLFMTLLAGYQALLARCSGQDDFCVGTPVAGRTRPEVEGVAGLFVNMLALRADLSGEPTGRDLLARARAAVLEAQARQEVPFERLVDALGVERNLAHTPLFQAVFAFHARAASPAFGDVGVRPLEVETGAAKFDLSVAMADDGERITGAATYRADLFDAATVRRTMERFTVLLEALAADPSLPVSRLPLLRPAQRTALVESWTRGAAGFPERRTLHALFEERAAAAPHAVAVTCDGEEVTYAELDARANRLAHRLRRLGVGREARVALCLERGMGQVVAILATVKAGGAYVPLDPAYPAERLAFVLEDSGAPVLLADRPVAFAVPEGVTVVGMDEGGLADEPETAPESGAGPESLAYVIYTSGSTGRPKGVLVEHRHVTRLFRATEAWFGFGARDVWTLFHSYAFDFSVWELWGALLYGGRLVVVPYLTSRSPDDFRRLLADERVTVLNQTPSAFRQLSAADERAGAASALSLRHVVFGGEALDPASLGPWFDRHGDRAPRMVNMYGITETTVHVTYRVITRADALAGGRSPIGGPIPDLRVYLLDRHGEPVPDGVPGEICVAGAGVARGYLNRPELTAQRFVDDPFVDGGRMYRSGDLGRMRAGGGLDYLGRIDQQVKIRGFRIEPGEIEAVLGAHPRVREAAVIARADGPGEARLVAYLAGADDAAPSLAAAAREWCAARLPTHMVPAAFVVLATLPLTENGKLDRRALPAPEEGVETGADEIAPPAGADEEAVLALWREVLRVERIGVHDDFFARGGDSILSIQLVARARRRGMALTPRMVFEHPTVAGQARALAAAAPVSASAEEDVAAGPAPLTPIQRWFFAQEHPSPHHYAQSLLLAPSAPLDAEAIRAALEAVRARHPALATRFVRDGEGWRAEPAGELPSPFSVADLSALAGEERARALREGGTAAQASPSLETGDLVRAVLFRGGGEDGGDRLLLAVHHLAVDGVSWRVLLDDLQAAYAAAARGESVDLPPAGASFAAWARRLEAHARSGALDAEAAFWADAEAAAPLPADFAAGENTVASAATVDASLDEAETEALLRGALPAYRARPEELLLAALARAWRGRTGGALRVALEGHGREPLFDDLDASRTVGWFTSLYPVTLDAGADPAPAAALKAVKERLRSVPAKGIGHGLLRWMGSAEVAARLAAAPEPEVAFNYLGQFDAVLGQGSLFSAAREDAGPALADDARRPYALEVTAYVLGGRLRIGVTYSEALHRRETAEALAAAFAAELRALLAHCLSAGAGGCTPSDFPLARLTQAEVDALPGGGTVLEDVYPLTGTQEGILFHSVLEPRGGAYLAQLAFDLEGDLDTDAFAAAWRAAVDRHPVLRTSFAWQEGDRPLQRVWRTAELPVVRADWRGMGEGEREARMEAFLRDDLARGFDLAAAPLMRLFLARTADAAWRLVWTQHHLILDGWSVPLVLRDVVEAYEAIRAGRAPSAAPARPYRDHVAWLLARPAGAAEAFWRGALEGFGAATPLGIDRPAARPGRPGHARLRLSPERYAAVEAALRRHGLTAGTLAQGAWALLLSRLSGTDDVLFGAVVSGRPAELDGAGEMVGLFINTLPVRVRVADDQPALSWLRALQASQAHMREHEHAPLAQVRRWSEVPAGEPLFESLFSFQNFPSGTPRGGAGRDALVVRRREAAEQTHYALTVSAAEQDGLLLMADFDTARLDAPAVERLLARLGALVERMAASPDALLGTLSVADEGERAAVLAAGTGDEAPAAPASFPALWSARVAASPAAPAAWCDGEVATYARVEARANRLARFLARRGIGREDRVALLLERGIDVAVATLAVLKAGAAYVPLDPAYPADRLAFMLADSGARILLTDTPSRGAAPAHAESVETVEIDARWGEIEREDDGPLAIEIDPEQLAYVIYTSGSTGRPKGVMLAHRELAGFAATMAERLALTPADRVLQFASPAFDVVVEELYPAWAAGASVVFSRAELPAPESLEGVLAEAGVTVLELPTAYWHEWAADLAASGRRLPPSVRRVLIGGERVLPERLRDWAGTGVALEHVFGLTETAVTTATLPLAPGDDGSRWANLPVGTPVAGARIHVLDRAGHPQPAGVPGELFIGGAGLARGYLARPALTAGRFVPDPFSPAPGARLYRTGDRVRWLDDGTLEFLGRIDQQVKIRGYRIEPAEVEAALAAHPAVREAVVAVREDAPGQKRLAAYVVAEGIDPDALRAALRETLPDYMVPSAVVRLDALPRTPNGKLDRRALPAPVPAAAESGGEAPRTAAEAALAAVWAEVLGVERMGTGASFFELGGDSVLTLQVVSKARRAGWKVTPRQVFEQPTLAALAAAAVPAGGAPAPAAEDAGGPAPLTPMQHHFFAQELPDPAWWNLSLLLRAHGPLDADALERALAALVARHDALRMRYLQVDGAWTQEAAEAGEAPPLERIDLSAVPAGEQAAAVEREAGRLQRSLELAGGTLLRAGLMELGDGRPGRVMLAVHHLAVDAVSWQVLMEELAQGYAQAARGEAVSLGAGSTPFAGWARRLAAHAAAGGFDGELPYWTDAARSDVAPLPLDFPGGRARDVEGAALRIARSLSAEETAALLAEVPAAYRTRMDEVLLAALARTLAGWTGAPAVLVDVEGHGREDLFDGVDLSRTAGYFTTVAPVLLDLSGARGPGDDLRAVKEQVRAVPGRGVGHGALRWLHPDPAVRQALAALPQPGVRFEYLGRLDGVAGAGGPLSIAPEGAGGGVDPRTPRTHPLVLSGGIVGGRLELWWTYGPSVHRRETAERLADGYLAALRALIAHCRSGGGGATPSDFTLVAVDQATLDFLESQLLDEDDGLD